MGNSVTLHKAIEEGDVAGVKQQLSSIHAEQQDEQGRTALLVASAVAEETLHPAATEIIETLITVGQVAHSALCQPIRLQGLS